MSCPIIDCHCHIYPDKIAEKATESIGEFYKLPMEYKGREEILKSEGERNGVRHFVVFSVATTERQVSSINRYISQRVEQSNGLFTGLGALHPDSKTMEADIDELVSLKLVGVKLHPDFQAFRLDEPRCEEIYRLCSERKLPLLLHTGDSRYDYSNPERLIPVLEKYPSLTVIGAHFGGWSCWERAAEMLHGYKNLYVDCSSSFDWLTRDKARNLIKKYGSERVLFGSDFPMWKYEKELEFLRSLDLTDAEMENILFRNASSLFHIKM